MRKHLVSSENRYNMAEDKTSGLSLVTEFAKRGLLHASNFSTLEVCNLLHILRIALKFCS